MPRIVLIACLLACAGCGAVPPYQAYPGRPLPAGEQARIVVHTDSASQARPGGAPALHISCVDGEPTNPSLIIIRYPTEVFVKPGRHYISVLYRHLNASSTASLWVDAEAGRTYTAHTALRGYTVRFWLTDSATGRPAGGVVGAGMTPAPGDRTCG